jgi:hypothetical protein
MPATIDIEAHVSWDGTGSFDGPDDDITPDVVAEAGILVAEGRQDSMTLSPPRIGDGKVTVWNQGGTYSQERADSPIYQRVVPARPVRFRVAHGTRTLYRSHILYRSHRPYRGRGMFPLGRHLIRDISQTTTFGQQQVELTTLGYETVLTKSVVTVGVMTAPRVDQCITALLDAVAWPTDKRSVAVADTTLLYWWCDERHPWDAMLELLQAEGPGVFYVDADGVFHFENRNYRTTATRSTVSQASFFDQDAGPPSLYRSHILYRSHRLYRGRASGLWFTALGYDPGFKNIYNRATYSTKRRVAGTPGTVIWSYGTSFALSGSQARTLIARPSDGNPFTTAITPVLTTDYTVSGGTVSVSLAASSGLVAFITVTATSGTPTVSALQLRATPLAVVSETVVENSIDASASIARFSPIPGQAIPVTLSVGGWAEIDVAMAEAVCNAWVTKYQVPRPLVTVSLRNADGLHVEQILRRMVSDRITLSERNTGLAGDVWINSISRRVADAFGATVEAVLSCEREDDVSGAVWDEDEWDDSLALWGI